MFDNAPLCDMRNNNFQVSLETTAVSCCKTYLRTGSLQYYELILWQSPGSHWNSSEQYC